MVSNTYYYIVTTLLCKFLLVLWRSRFQIVVLFEADLLNAIFVQNVQSLKVKYAIVDCDNQSGGCVTCLLNDCCVKVSQQAFTCTSAAAFQLHLQRLDPSSINNFCNNSEGVECGEEKGKEIYM